MTYEATKIELFGANNDGQPINCVYSGTALALKGTLVAFSGGTTTAGTRIVQRAMVKHDPAAGILGADASGAYVVGTDYPTVPVLTQGTFNMYISGTGVTAGMPVAAYSQAGSANMVDVAVAAISASGAPVVIGYTVATPAAHLTGTKLGPVRLNL